MFNFRRKTRREIEAESVDALFTAKDARPGLAGAIGLVSGKHRYRRTEIATGVNFYSAGKSAGTLVVGFGTMKGRLSMPVFMVLDALDDTRYDLLLLSDLSKRHFDIGIGAFARTLPDLAGRIRDFAGERGHKALVTFGSSMGGFPALRAGDLMRADRSISVGGRFAWHPSRLRKVRHTIHAFEPLCACRAPFGSPFYALFSRDNASDSRHAALLAEIAPNCRTIAFPGDAHGLHYEIQLKGRLDAFFAEMLDLTREPDADRLAAMLD